MNTIITFTLTQLVGLVLAICALKHTLTDKQTRGLLQ